MSDRAAGTPVSTTNEGGVIELIFQILSEQAAYMAANPNGTRVIDSYRTDFTNNTFSFSGVIPITWTTDPTTGATIITAAPKF